MKLFAGVSESLLPFINGPHLLKFDTWFLAGKIKGHRRSSSSFSPQIVSRSENVYIVDHKWFNSPILWLGKDKKVPPSADGAEANGESWGMIF